MISLRYRTWPSTYSENANALAFFIFVRSFFQAWGITIGATVLQNELRSCLPNEFLSQLHGVRAAFACSLDVLWEVMVGMAGLGLLSSLMMKEMPLQNVVDEK
ncbi:hypothetical protein OBBRIDRAFT_724168 [Obba rivulosa]|uniref:Uncharacterized protein n=1 Tax=Obba rivulosa TaxID=1052685 RepID=A0A8E2DQG1_9APHY|nr:hypothetical protein OBBRIDRAFT_724168 [Obba rivulosa]